MLWSVLLVVLPATVSALMYRCEDDQVLVVQSFGNDTIRMHCQRLDVCGYRQLRCDYDESQPQCGGLMNFVAHVTQSSPTSPVEHTCCNLFNPRAPHTIPTHVGNDCFIYELPDGTNRSEETTPDNDILPYTVLKNAAEIPEHIDGLSGYRLRFYLLRNKAPPTLLVKGIERRLNGYRVTICRPRCTSYDAVASDASPSEWKAITWSSWTSSTWSTWARNVWGNGGNTLRRQRGDESRPVASDSSGFPADRQAHGVNVHVNASGNSNNIVNQNLPFDKGPSQINITVHTDSKQLHTGEGTNFEGTSNRSRIRNGSLKSDENDGQNTARRNRHHRKEDGDNDGSGNSKSTIVSSKRKHRPATDSSKGDDDNDDDDDNDVSKSVSGEGRRRGKKRGGRRGKNSRGRSAENSVISDDDDYADDSLNSNGDDDRNDRSNGNGRTTSVKEDRRKGKKEKSKKKNKTKKKAGDDEEDAGGDDDGDDDDSDDRSNSGSDGNRRNRPDGKTGGDGELLGAGESDSGRGKHGDKNGGKKGDLNVGDVDKSDSKKGKAGGKNLKGTGDDGKSDSKEVEVKIGDSKSRGDSDSDGKKSKSKDGKDSGKIPKTKGGLGDGGRKSDSKEGNDKEGNPKKKGNRGVVDVKSELKGKNQSGEDLKKQKGSPGEDEEKSDSKGRKGDGGNLKAGGNLEGSEGKGNLREEKDNGGNLKSKGDLGSSEEKLNIKEGKKGEKNSRKKNNNNDGDGDNNNSGKSDNSRSEKPTGKGGAGSDSGRNPGDKAKSGKGDGERSRQAGDGSDRTESSGDGIRGDSGTNTPGNELDKHRGKNKGQGSQVGKGSKGKNASDGDSDILRPERLGSTRSGPTSGANGSNGNYGTNGDSSTPGGSMNAGKLGRKGNKLDGDNPDLLESDGKLNGIDRKNGKRGKNGRDGEALNKQAVTDEPLIVDGTTKRTIEKSKNKQTVDGLPGDVTVYPDVLATDGFINSANAGGPTISVKASNSTAGLDGGKSVGLNSNPSAGQTTLANSLKSGAVVANGSQGSTTTTSTNGSGSTTRSPTTSRVLVGGSKKNNTGRPKAALAAAPPAVGILAAAPPPLGAAAAAGVPNRKAGGKLGVMHGPQATRDALNRLKRMNCFPADAIVTTVTGPKRMDQLAVGDFVLIPSASDVLKYERVEMFYHREPETRANFVVLMTESKKRIALTPLHLLPFGDCESMRRSVENADGIEQLLRSSRFADRAKVGDCLMTVDDNGRMTIERIVKIGRQISEGIYSPMTVTGSLLVDGVLSSCFSQVESHTVQKIVFDFFVYVRQFLGLHPGRYVEREGIPLFISYIHDFSHMFLPFSNF